MTYAVEVPIRVSLDRYLAARGITTYKLMKQLKGRLAQGTVYSLAQGESVERLDLKSLYEVMRGLEELTGERVTPNDLLEITEN